MNIFINSLSKIKISFVNDYALPILTPLQKKIIAIAAAVFACLTLAYVLIRHCYFKEGNQAENREKEQDKTPEIVQQILTPKHSPKLEEPVEVENEPEVINITLYNQFMKEFSGSEKAEYKKIVGKANNLVSSVFIKNFGNEELFNNNIRALPIEDSLKDKAIDVGSKYFKIHFKVEEFKQAVGGEKFANSNNTLQVAKLYEEYLLGIINKEQLYNQINAAPKEQISGPAKAKAKEFITSISEEAITPLLTPIETPIETPVETPVATTAATTTAAQKFQWNADEIKANYKKLIQDNKIKVRRMSTGFIEIKNPGGAVNIGYQVALKNPDAKIGIMLAANSGLPGGALGKRPNDVHPKDLKMTTQEESVWANAILTAAGTDPKKQQSFHENTISGKWGMQNQKGTSTHTLQGIDFTTTEKVTDYNQVFLVNNCSLSALDQDKNIITGTEYPVVFVFADSINANAKIGTPEGTMQRTLNKKAITDYDFFRECVKQKMRSALDGMASEGVTHPLIALLSCGIYAGDHKGRINKEFGDIVQELFDEEVGPNGEKRGVYFEQPIIAKV